jgi:catechol 2,3-dioxygenase-like lactoylglutathione lyase family enzyme
MEPVPFHVGITTDDLGASMRHLAGSLGVSWTAPGSGGGLYHSVDGRPQPQPLSCISREGPIHIDLIQGEQGTIWDTASGPRLHHFAYWTDDLAGDVERLAATGWRLELTQPGPGGEPTVFAYLIRDDGFRIELIDDAGREGYSSRLNRDE